MLKYKWEEGYVKERHDVFPVVVHLENQFANQRGSRMRLDEAKGDARFLEEHVIIEESNGEW